MKLNKDRKFKKCFITGITGSGGSYLAEHIYKKDASEEIVKAVAINDANKMISRKILLLALKNVYFATTLENELFTLWN